MKTRTIQLSEGTQTLINALLDLEKVSGDVYQFVRAEFSKDDSVDDPTGQEVLDASNKLRDVIEDYLKDRFYYSLSLTKNLNGTEVVI